jgi:uncharacterized repeat protein (TIGR03803 family)
LGVLLAVVSLACAQPLKLEVLASFYGTNGANSQAGLIQGSDGGFYGTTRGGGRTGNGTAFRVTTNGELTTLASFNFTNGANPVAGLAQGNDGNFYGTTFGGGNYDAGTVFKLTTNGLLSLLASFDGTNQAQPRAGLALGSDGRFYGTTSAGSDQSLNQGYGGGTVFQITTNGVLTRLIPFTGNNGAYPYASLTPGNDGSFYGTTYQGGDDFDPMDHGMGTVFQVTTNAPGFFYPVVSFGDYNGLAGRGPETGVTLGSDGNLYGTIDYAFPAAGGVFR